MEQNVQRAESILAILVSEYEEKVYFVHFDCTTLAAIHSSALLRRSLPSPPLHNASPLSALRTFFIRARCLQPSNA
jgi:hypothetical protein